MHRAAAVLLLMAGTVLAGCSDDGPAVTGKSLGNPPQVQDRLSAPVPTHDGEACAASTFAWRQPGIAQALRPKVDRQWATVRPPGDLSLHAVMGSWYGGIYPASAAWRPDDGGEVRFTYGDGYTLVEGHYSGGVTDTRELHDLTTAIALATSLDREAAQTVALDFLSSTRPRDADDDPHRTATWDNTTRPAALLEDAWNGTKPDAWQATAGAGFLQLRWRSWEIWVQIPSWTRDLGTNGTLTIDGADLVRLDLRERMTPRDAQHHAHRVFDGLGLPAPRFYQFAGKPC